MALITTFSTTPLAAWLYPPSYQKKLASWKRGEIDWDTGEPISSSGSSRDDPISAKAASDDRIRRLLVYLRLDNMPATLGLVTLFGIPFDSETRRHPGASTIEEAKASTSATASSESVPKRPVRAHALRLVQLTDRDSSVMTVSQVDEYSRNDPVVNTFRTVGQLHNVAASGEVAVMPETRFAEVLINKSSNISADLLLVPWSETGGVGDSQILSSTGIKDKLAQSYTNFVKSITAATQHNIAIFFPQSGTDAAAIAQSGERAKLTRTYSFSSIKHDLPDVAMTARSHHIFLPYFGGDDDRYALHLVLQLLEKPDVTATIVRVFVQSATEGAESEGNNTLDDYFDYVSSKVPPSISERVKFDRLSVGNTFDSVVERASAEAKTGSGSNRRHNLVVVARRAGPVPHVGKLSAKTNEDVVESLGSIAAHLIASSLQADLLVLQAKNKGVVES
jgi:hypothetical protein